MATGELVLMTADEVGAVLCKSGRDVRRLIARGELKAYRVGTARGSLRVASSELARWLEAVEAQRVPVESR
jgi:excisionase family DNA binding protein